MSVLLVNSSRDLMLPILYLGTYLRENDVSFEIFNLGSLEKEGESYDSVGKLLNKRIEKNEVIGFSCQTRNYSRIAWYVHNYYHNGGESKTFVLGGTHPSSIPIRSLKDGIVRGKAPLFNVSVIGYGEQTLVDLVNKNLKNVSNIAYVDKNLEIKKNKIDEKAFTPPMFNPDWSLVERVGRGVYSFEEYNLPVNYTWGCPNSVNPCSYCNSLKPKIQRKNPSLVVDYIEDNLRKYKLSGISLCDDNEFARTGYIKEFLNLLTERGLEDISIDLAVDPSILIRDYSKIKSLLDSYKFKYTLSFSLEFCDDAHFNRWNRLFLGKKRDWRLEKEVVAKFIKSSDSQYSFYTNYITPCPEDTLMDYYNTCVEAIKMSELRENAMDLPFFTSLAPYPGTKSFDYVTKKGLWKDCENEDVSFCPYLWWGIFDTNSTSFILEPKLEEVYNTVLKKEFYKGVHENLIPLKEAEMVKGLVEERFL